MKFIQADIDSIAMAQENDSLTVFIGAGFSKFSETNTIRFPSWGELIETLKSELNTKETDYLKIAQLYFIEFGEFKLYQKLRSFIPLDAKPSDFHIKVFQVLQPKYIITTNWDNLLEKTIVENGLIYDIVKTESDLIKSTLPNKLIKVHGDFESHNIIFKEDDYLNYSVKNPLFDNFLKHILSTTTVVFLGYSYSDIDLKQIIKWIEKNSKISPPRFILNKNIESSEKNYLQNHGIKYLEVTSDEIISDNIEFKKLYEKFFYSIENTLNEESFFYGEKIPDADVVAYFYNKLIGLRELNTLLPEQITNVFSNCTIEYHHNCFGLEFHSKLLTIDYNHNIRSVYAKFFEIIYDENKIKIFKDKLDNIFSLFLSAGVVFIKKSDSIFNIIEYFKSEIIDTVFNGEENNFSKFISFSSKMPKVHLDLLTFHNKSEEEKLLIFKNLSDEVTQYLARKQYLLAMISKFNKSVFAYQLSNDKDITKDLRDQFGKDTRYNFDDELINNKYPYKSKKHFQPFIDLLNFKSIYRFHYDSTIDNKTFLEAEKNRKNGGFHYSNSEQRSNDRLIQLLRFCAENNVVLDLYSEFKQLMVSYVTGKIEISKVNEVFKFSIYDLFIMIKYFKFKDILSILLENVIYFVREPEKEGNGENLLQFGENEKEYIKTVFKNLSELFIKYSDSFYSNIISDSYCNLILILGLVNWDKEELNKFIYEIKNSLLKANIPYKTISSINHFILLQYKLYKTNNGNFLKLIDAVLEGFVLGKFKSPLYEKINHDLSYLYNYSVIMNIAYSTIDLVEKVIFLLRQNFKNDKRAQRFYIQNILLPVYQISNDKIKSIFIDYFNELRINHWQKINDKEELYEEIFRELDFLQNGCEIKENFLTFLNKWINEDLNKEVYSSIKFLKAGGIEFMLGLIKFLVNEKKLNQFSEIYDRLRDKIAKEEEQVN
ncbi:SIR2 family protein [Avibacterium paragallinarum]|uniref:SIR2 family protein n=1 Tax=Avibacterium paragallinarum TaxID=728 RepID=UPI00397C9583